MIKREDVNQMIAKAVKEAVANVTTQYEQKMKDMAAEYEAEKTSINRRTNEEPLL